MARDIKVAHELAVKFATERDKNTPYVRWVEAKGLEIIPAHYVANLRPVALEPWTRREGRLEARCATGDPFLPTRGKSWVC